MPAPSPFLDADAIRAATFVRHAELHDSLPSTNDRALELAGSADLTTPALIVARLQTAGRGRGKNAWWSTEGALTFSVILDTATWGITQRDWPRLSLTTAVSVCDAIEPIAPCAIKWPNDILIDSRKVCGVLIESAAGDSTARDRLIVGIGINVNNSLRAAQSDVASNSVALCDVAKDRLSLESLLVTLLQSLKTRLQQLADGVAALPKNWQEHSWLTDRDVVVTNAGGTCSGRCRGIAEDGALLLETSAGPERIFSGSVQLP